MKDALDILNRVWGYDSFRKKQDVIIQNIIDKKDTLALLPTGGGKSICYQVPGILLEGTCLVISPLIALMQDQVAQLRKRGIMAVAISSGMSRKEIDIQLDNAIYGSTKFLYVSPERLKTPLFKARLEKMNINLIAVDEAHCISQWGYDFRPSYLEIAELRKIKPNTPYLALTATATSEVIKDIQEKLEFKKTNLVSDSFERANIAYNVLQSNNKINRIQEFLAETSGSGIIYCSTRKGVKSLCKHLLDQGVSANFYHGGVDFETRNERQLDWINNKFQIMVCTNAFGMGIDKPDVRFVLHFDMPETIEAYFQEAGRAGRDGSKAQTSLYFEPVDIDKLREKIELKYPPLDSIRNIYKALGNHLQLAIGSGLGESFKVHILEFCDKYQFDLITVYNSFKFLETAGFLALSENFKSPSKLQIITDPKNLYQYQVKDENTNKVIQFLLRTQMGIFENLATISEHKVSQHTKLPERDVSKILSHLSDSKVVTYIPQLNGTYITYLTERLAEGNLSLPTEIYHRRKEASISKMESMIEYVTSDKCTSKFLLEYFGEINVQNCGECSSCVRNSNTIYVSDLKKDINNYLNSLFNNQNEVMIQDVISALSQYTKDEILENIRWMIDHDQLKADSLGKSLIKS